MSRFGEGALVPSRQVVPPRPTALSGREETPASETEQLATARDISDTISSRIHNTEVVILLESGDPRQAAAMAKASRAFSPLERERRETSSDIQAVQGVSAMKASPLEICMASLALTLDGGAFCKSISRRFGRKGGLLMNNIFAIIAAIFFGFCKLANSYVMIIIARFFIGVNNGLNAGLAPMYLSEIAPVNLRGAIGTVYQLVVTISILFSQIMGLESILGTADLWPILLALTALPAVFQLVTLPICPESPKYLLINKEEAISAQRALTWLRDTSNVQEEMGEMRNEAEAAKLVPHVSLREITTNPTLRIPLVISMMMMIAQQLSGINAVIFFSTKIYLAAGLSDEASLNATIAMGTMNVLMTICSLVMVEKFGRKTLMLAGLFGMLVDVLLLFICLLLKDLASWISFLSIFLVIFFVVMFAVGPGSIPWFLVTELFAQNARPVASSIAVAVNWTAAFIVGLGFLPIQEIIGPYVFLIFVILLSLFILFTWKKVPETKGRSIDEITAMFKQSAYGGNSV
ncbi:solute carrier family 2, facilitated glucose transporter member 1-like [Penaeus indicus]|uniref:solute carrier family 2, facilitated glucose transporter member 1-like n=1 Tax=Penaeus indicus TaxID=29960 RepID=UPI00300CADBF